MYIFTRYFVLLLILFLQAATSPHCVDMSQCTCKHVAESLIGLKDISECPQNGDCPCTSGEYKSGSNECSKCSDRCTDTNAKLINNCGAGSKADTTGCICNDGYYGAGTSIQISCTKMQGLLRLCSNIDPMCCSCHERHRDLQLQRWILWQRFIVLAMQDLRKQQDSDP